MEIKVRAIVLSCADEHWQNVLVDAVFVFDMLDAKGSLDFQQEIVARVVAMRVSAALQRLVADERQERATLAEAVEKVVLPVRALLQALFVQKRTQAPPLQIQIERLGRVGFRGHAVADEAVVLVRRVCEGLRRASELQRRHFVFRIRHVLRNVAIPLVTFAGVILVQILGGVVVVETLFAIPGLGRTLLSAIQARDYPVLQGALLLAVFVSLLVNLLVDLAYAAIDPRVRGA
jgi:hypothetical protein